MKRLKSVIVLSILILTACGRNPIELPEESSIVEVPTTIPEFSAMNIRANGILLPSKQLDLSFGTGGFIESVDVQVGESVTSGQVLVQLDPTEIELALQSAEAELTSAQASLDLILSRTPTEKEIAKSSALLELISTQQSLADLYLQADLVAAKSHLIVIEAEKSVADAQRELNGMMVSIDQSTIDSAYANMVLAKDSLEKAQEAYQPWENKSETNTTRATLLSKLADAQQVYNAAVRKYNGFTGNASEYDVAQSEANYSVAQAQFVIAQERYDFVKDGPDSDEIAKAEARIASANAKISLSEIDLANQVAISQAQVDIAQVNLKIIQSQMENMVITAPFDGIISALHVNLGEWAMPGETMIVLIDTSGWKIETKNVGELQIGQVEIGQEVKISVNAFKNDLLFGKVIAISPVPVVQQGDTTYNLSIELDDTNLNLWPGMTAQLEIETRN